MVVRDYGMDEFVDEFCDGMKPSAAIRAYNSCKETYDWMRDGLYLSNGDIASLSEVISENEEEIGALVEKAASERAARYAYDHPKLPKGFVTNQFSLDGGIPAWTVEGDDLAKVNDFLKKSCMEFSGSLPGDEKDEDGYSLTGEAKDATASRNGLNRNQMGIEEKAAECKEAATVLANGNAL